MRIALGLLWAVRLSHGHSWLACSDYDPSTDTCNGYARNWYSVMAGASFSTDRGRDNRPGVDFPQGLVCNQAKEARTNPVTAAYDTTYPMATLSTGQTVTWRWPAKNHCDVGIQRGVQVFISKTADASVDDFRPEPIAEMSFSECIPRQPGVDNANCYDTWDVPTDLAPGVYTLMWWWEFNQGEFYNTCADVNIVGGSSGGGGGSTPTPAPTTPSTSADYVAFRCDSPTKIPSTGSFDVDVDFNAIGDRTVVIQVVDENSLSGTPYGEGTFSTTRTGGITSYPVPVSMSVVPSASTGESNYVLKAWTVPTTVWQSSPGTATNNATSEAYAPVQAGSSVEFGTCSSSSGTPRESYTLVAIFATLFGVGVIGAALFFKHTRAKALPCCPERKDQPQEMQNQGSEMRPAARRKHNTHYSNDFTPAQDGQRTTV